ncbi:thioredoxin family protein [Nakamurella endophytica]|uniref:Thioredoxin n=1 Tax=Nakamurella endophytica TaxID=1748367 RepID=A0A917SX89_9ACTN|nr:thioredoxin domain-containing protein [Nakamurella endophytica]GGM00631.1 thioredoxin [Nakamurella endophytica]
MTLPATGDATFGRDVLAAAEPVLVDFTAGWCPPCVMVKPALERIAADLAGRLRVVTLDVDQHPGTAARYRVLGLPTLALFVGGELVTQLTGARPRAAILAAVEPHLAAAAAR